MPIAVVIQALWVPVVCEHVKQVQHPDLVVTRIKGGERLGQGRGRAFTRQPFKIPLDRN